MKGVPAMTTLEKELKKKARAISRIRVCYVFFCSKGSSFRFMVRCMKKHAFPALIEEIQSKGNDIIFTGSLPARRAQVRSKFHLLTKNMRRIAAAFNVAAREKKLRPANNEIEEMQYFRATG